MRKGTRQSHADPFPEKTSLLLPLIRFKTTSPHLLLLLLTESGINSGRNSMQTSCYKDRTVTRIRQTLSFPGRILNNVSRFSYSFLRMETVIYFQSSAKSKESEEKVQQFWRHMPSFCNLNFLPPDSLSFCNLKQAAPNLNTHFGIARRHR